MIRLLVVTYYFPPAGGAGVQRVLKWVKYFRDFGIDPVVLTVDAGAYPKRDETLLEEVPEGVEVHRTGALDPFGLYARITGRSRQEAVGEQLQSAPEGIGERVARWVRANLVLPDARVGWVPFAVRRAKQLHREKPFDAVLTSGPPHSVHLIGRAMRRRHLPWIADFRDPWTDIHYYQSLPRTRAAEAFDKMLERSVLRTADAATVVSPSWRALLAGKTPHPPAPFAVIHNGYDTEDFEALVPPPAHDHFVLTYVGTLYGSPAAVWEAVARLHQSGRADRLRLRLVGHVPEAVRTAIREQGLDAITSFASYVPHSEAVREMVRATVLLLTLEDWPYAEGLITGKLYEYLASGRPILGIGPSAGDAAELLEQTGAGRMFDWHDAEGVFQHLAARYERWASGTASRGAAPDAIAPYARRAQTEHLADLIRRVVQRFPAQSSALLS